MTTNKNTMSLKYKNDDEKDPSHLPDVLPGFEHINRYWDKHTKMHAVKILPGQYYVTRGPEMIVTVLGSCISACVRDKVSGIGGMNHFLLPLSRDGKDHWRANDPSAATRYGNYAMEHMINDILSHGGRRRLLEIKICGGGRVLQEMKFINIGQKNIDFVKDYILTEGLNLIGEDVGGVYPRKVQYLPTTGELRIKKLRTMHNDTIIKRELEYERGLEEKPVSGDVELF